MSAIKGLFTATDWMAYYEKLFRDDTAIKVNPISLQKGDREEEVDQKTKDSSKS